MKRSVFRAMIVLMMATVLLVVTTSMSFAATSTKSVVYEGSGKVTVSYRTKVTYEEVDISVKDNSGKTYSTSIKKKSSSSITFLIKSYKAGKSYKFTINGIKGGAVTGSFKIYSKSKAMAIAKSAAKSAWGVKSFSNVKASSSTYRNQSTWKVSFQEGDHSYTYMVAQQTGKILWNERK